MPKVKKAKKEIKKVNKVENIVDKSANSEVEEEVLPEDVQQALGIVKPSKARVKEIDYVAELENGLDDFGFEESSSKNTFDEDFDSDM